jgi:hypothetical protein
VRVKDPTSGLAGHWRNLIESHNKNAPPHRPRIPVTMTPSDWRDIYAHFVFKDSRYSWVLVQWALGHKHMRSTRNYLRSRLWRHYSENKLTNLITVVIDGIEVHARVDATIIRASVEFNHVADEADLTRLKNHRIAVQERELSYTGHACSDPFHPPQEIDPGNPADGTKRCRRSDRCPSCPLAQAIDSWHMSKRVAELQWLRTQVSEVIWCESHYSVDLESLQAELKQWPADHVAAQIEHWEHAITSGKHKVLRFGGKQ